LNNYRFFLEKLSLFEVIIAFVESITKTSVTKVGNSILIPCMQYTLQTENLDFSFGKKQILNKLALKVPQGSIYGFLGPNGAGKSTTIRLLLGLLPVYAPQASLQIFGQSLAQNRLQILQRVGALVEMPSLYEHLNARENLEVTRVWLGKIPKNRIEEVLRIVELTNEAHRPVKQYSLGMKQRLGLAISLLNNPELLILDEPTNGLDPAGIKDIRELIVRLHKEEGKTIFVSSHLLSEIEKMVTHVGIIHKGTLHFQGDLPTLQAQQQSYTLFNTNDNTRALPILQNILPETALVSDGLHLPTQEKSVIHQINQTCLQSDLEVYQIQPVLSSLEDMFMEITEN
jgi:ABC-2 type transport system ATP-binding protein